MPEEEARLSVGIQDGTAELPWCNYWARSATSPRIPGEALLMALHRSA